MRSGAERLTRDLDAQAYTTGEHIVVRRDYYDPHSTPGRHLLAHELAHTIQQRHATRPVIQRRRIGEPLPDGDAPTFDAPVAWGYDEKTNEVFASVLPPGHSLADIAEYLHGSPHYEFQLRDENDLSGEPVPAGTRIRLGDAELTDEAQDELLRAWEDNTILRVQDEFGVRDHGQVYTVEVQNRIFELTGLQYRALLRQQSHALVESAQLIVSAAQTGRELHEAHKQTMGVRRWISDTLASQSPPPLMIWDLSEWASKRVIDELSNADSSDVSLDIWAQRVSDAAEILDRGVDSLQEAEKTWSDYRSNTVEGAEEAVDLTRDIALSAAISAAAFWAAPAIAGALAWGTVASWGVAVPTVLLSGGALRGGAHSGMYAYQQHQRGESADGWEMFDEFREGHQLGLVDAGAGVAGYGAYSGLARIMGANTNATLPSSTRALLSAAEGTAAGGFEGMGRGVLEGARGWELLEQLLFGMTGGAIFGGGFSLGGEAFGRGVRELSSFRTRFGEMLDNLRSISPGQLNQLRGEMPDHWFSMYREAPPSRQQRMQDRSVDEWRQLQQRREDALDGQGTWKGADEARWRGYPEKIHQRQWRGDSEQLPERYHWWLPNKSTTSPEQWQPKIRVTQGDTSVRYDPVVDEFFPAASHPGSSQSPTGFPFVADILARSDRDWARIFRVANDNDRITHWGETLDLFRLVSALRSGQKSLPSTFAG